MMLERFLKEEEHAVVLFYDEDERDGRVMRDILKSLEAVDDKIDKVYMEFLDDVTISFYMAYYVFLTHTVCKPQFCSLTNKISCL